MAILSIDSRPLEGRVHVELTGELDISNADKVEQELQRVESGQPPLLVLDLRQLTFMDSTGLRLVVQADERARAADRRFAIIRGPEQVQRVFEIVGLDRRLDLVPEPPQ